jgi:hypothetical protein
MGDGLRPWNFKICAQVDWPSDSDPILSARFRSDFMSVSTNSTASNLVGAGRGIGNLYSRGGRILERAISNIAHKLGFGPYAVSLRIMSLFPELDILFFARVGLLESKTKDAANGLDRLLMYIECVSRHVVNYFCWRWVKVVALLWPNSQQSTDWL